MTSMLRETVVTMVLIGIVIDWGLSERWPPVGAFVVLRVAVKP